MHAALRAVLAMAILVVLAPRAFAQPGVKADPDWPCQQIKTPTFSLASVWAGPQLDLSSQSWRDESDVADLMAKMAERRVPDRRRGAGDRATSRRRAAPMRTPSFSVLSPRPSRICRSNAPKSSAASNVPATSSTPWPLVSARRTRPFKDLRTRTMTAKRRPPPTAKTAFNGTCAFSTIAVRP